MKIKSPLIIILKIRKKSKRKLFLRMLKSNYNLNLKKSNKFLQKFKMSGMPELDSTQEAKTSQTSTNTKETNSSSEK